MVLGLDPKRASATTAFIVIFISLAGFFGHIQTGLAPLPLLVPAAILAGLGAWCGAWLLTNKLKASSVKHIIGGVLLMIAAKVIYDLILG